MTTNGTEGLEDFEADVAVPDGAAEDADQIDDVIILKNKQLIDGLEVGHHMGRTLAGPAYGIVLPPAVTDPDQFQGMHVLEVNSAAPTVPRPKGYMYLDLPGSAGDRSPRLRRQTADDSTAISSGNVWDDIGPTMVITSIGAATFSGTTGQSIATVTGGPEVRTTIQANAGTNQYYALSACPDPASPNTPVVLLGQKPTTPGTFIYAWIERTKAGNDELVLYNNSGNNENILCMVMRHTP